MYFAGDKQAAVANDCNADPPAASCSASGGAYYKLRYPKTTGGSISFMIFWAPTSEGTSGGSYQDAVDACTGYDSFGAQPDMLDLLDCVTGKVDGNRGALTVAFGNGLQAEYTNVFFVNQPSKWTDAGNGVQHDGVEATFMVLGPAP